MVPNLHFFNVKRFDALPVAERKEYLKMQRLLAIPDGHPYFIGNFEDGYNLDDDLNGFCEYLITPKRTSPHTWRSYSYYAAECIDFLNEQGCHWLNATNKHLNYYYRTKTNGTENVRKVEPQTWNVIQNAIVHLYEYAVDKKKITETPFSYRQSYSHYHHGKTETSELATSATPAPLNYISIEQYKTHWRPLLVQQKHAQRNISLIELLICSGFRISEALGLNIYGIPDPDSTKYEGLSVVPISVIGKGRKKRIVPVPKRIIRAIQFYIEEERENAVSQYKKMNGSKSIPDRVFLAETGNPLSKRAVEDLFQEVSKATGIKLTPHGCRHLYATIMLSSLIEIAKKKDLAARDRGANMYSKLLGDPLQIVQKLLGHASVETVFIYLELVGEVRGMVEDALTNWTQTVA